MYRSYYSFAHSPFSKRIKTSDAFSSTDFQGAMAGLDYLRKTKGIGLLTGDPGAGKTFTLRAFKESLSSALYHVIYFPMSTGGVMDFYRALAYGLGASATIPFLISFIPHTFSTVFAENKIRKKYL